MNIMEDIISHFLNAVDATKSFFVDDEPCAESTDMCFLHPFSTWLCVGGVEVH